MFSTVIELQGLIITVEGFCFRCCVHYWK